MLFFAALVQEREKQVTEFTQERDIFRITIEGQRDKEVECVLRITVKEDLDLQLVKEGIKWDGQECVKGTGWGLAFWMWPETCCMVALD